MPSDPSLNRYFTEQVVGRPFAVSLGSSPKSPLKLRHGVLVDWASNRMRLTRKAARTLTARDTGALLAGEPVPIGTLRRLRWGLVAGAWLLWSVGLVAACVYLLEWNA